jgi:hypothetical protein
LGETCPGVGGGILKNCLFMHCRLDAEAAGIEVVAVVANAKTALFDQIAHVMNLFTAELV